MINEVMGRTKVVPDSCAAQKMKFSIKDFFSKCDQILMKNVSFCAVLFEYDQVPNMARTKLFKTFVTERFDNWFTKDLNGHSNVRHMDCPRRKKIKLG